MPEIARKLELWREKVVSLNVQGYQNGKRLHIHIKGIREA